MMARLEPRGLDRLRAEKYVVILASNGFTFVYQNWSYQVAYVEQRNECSDPRRGQGNAYVFRPAQGFASAGGQTDGAARY
ncbi:hypothetical protein GGER_52550 [Serratia rubidaea]